MPSTTLTWDPNVSQPINVSHNDGQEGIEIYRNFLYATDFIGSNIDIYRINPKTGELSYASSFGARGDGVGEFGATSPVDMSFFELSDGSTKAYLPEAIHQRIVVLDVNQQTGALSWDETNTLPARRAELTTPYGIEINGNFLYATDYGGSNIDIYEIDRNTGGLTYLSAYGSKGNGVDQFSAGSPVDISFLELSSGLTKAYVPDAENRRIVVLTVDTQTGALSWDAALTLPNALPSSTLQYGLEIYENTLYVTDWGGHDIDIYDIDLETGAIAYSHSVGSEGSESEQFITPVDLDFYKATDGIARAYVPDSGNRRIAALTVSEPELKAVNQGLLAVGGIGQTQLTLTLQESQTEGISEVIVISTNNAEGTIGGVSPANASYLLAAKAHTQVVFSVLDRASTPPGITLERTIDVEGGSYLNFVVIQGGSLQDAIDHPELVTISFGAQVLSAQNRFSEDDAPEDGASEDGDPASTPPVQIGLGAGNTNPGSTGEVGDIVLTAKLENRSQPIGSALQNGSAESELIDLTEVSGSLTAEFEVYREAEFKSTVGFFTVENAQGGVLDENDVLLAPGEAGYAIAALKQRLDVGLSSSDEAITRYAIEVEGGQMLSAFIIVDGTFEDFLTAAATPDTGDDLHIFFTHMGANSGRGDHVKLLGDNVFGFEDTVGGGDGDFDDIVVKAKFT